MAAVVALLISLPLAAGCTRGDAPSAESTEGGESLDGLSPEQIRQQAQPMSPERAEELGIIDTTIHMEQLTSPADSLLLRDSAERAVRDTVM